LSDPRHDTQKSGSGWSYDDFCRDFSTDRFNRGSIGGISRIGKVPSAYANDWNASARETVGIVSDVFSNQTNGDFSLHAFRQFERGTECLVCRLRQGVTGLIDMRYKENIH
jgi:hypothetical protein